MPDRPVFCRSEKCALVQSNSGVEYDVRFDDFSIKVGDTGQIRQQLFFCLWCGAELPRSRRDEWFDQLEMLGVDPYLQEVPEDFKTDAWRSK